MSRDVKSGSAEEERPEGEIEEVDLLEECDMLEQENLWLRQRLEKAELALIQKNHDKEDPDVREDPRVIQVTCTMYESGHSTGRGSAVALSYICD